MRALFAKHGLSLALAALWVALLVVSWATKDDEWVTQLVANHAGDAFGALLIVVATKFLVERGSAESKRRPDDPS